MAAEWLSPPGHGKDQTSTSRVAATAHARVPALPAGPLRAGCGMWRARLVHARFERVPRDDAPAVAAHPQDPPGRQFARREAVEHEIAEAVDDRPAAIDSAPCVTCGWPPMTASAPASIIVRASCALARGRMRLVLPAPVHEGNHDVRRRRRVRRGCPRPPGCPRSRRCRADSRRPRRHAA